MNAKPLCTRFNVATLHIASRLMPCGFDVLDVAPATLDASQAYLARTGRIGVWEGASDRTIFGDAEVNYAFRAWHDWTHLRHGFAFNERGEAYTAATQQKHLRTVYGAGILTEWHCALVWAEVVGQSDFQRLHGIFPEDQRAFTQAWLWEHNLPTRAPLSRVH